MEKICSIKSCQFSKSRNPDGLGKPDIGFEIYFIKMNKKSRDLTRWWSGLILIADVADFVSDGESLVLQNSIYVAMATSVAVTFSDPIANVQGLACLAWANKVNWNTEKHRLIPRLTSKKCQHLLFIMHYKQSRVSSSYQSSLNMFKQVYT